MTSNVKGGTPIALHAAFDDETQAVKNKKKSKVREETEITKDSEGKTKKKEKEEKEQKKKNEKKDEKEKDKGKPEEGTKPKPKEPPLPEVAQPEKDIGGKPSGKELGKQASKNDESKVLPVPIVANTNVHPDKSESEPNESKKPDLKKKKESVQEMHGDEDSEGIVIRAAPWRDFCEDRTESDNRRKCNEPGTGTQENACKEKRIRDEKGRGLSICRRQYSRDSCRRNDFQRDACTTTRNGLPDPCQYLIGPKKESGRDLCERKKRGESGKCDWENSRTEDYRTTELDRWCEDRTGRTGTRVLSREDKGKSKAAFNRLDTQSTGSITDRSGGAEGRGGDWKGNHRKPTNESSTDEVRQLKSDLTNLQAELDRLKDCLRAAAVAAEKNKCTITRMREHLRCNFPCGFPDFARIREKLKNCHLMKAKLCQEFKLCSGRDHWRKDLECLMKEVRAIKCELEKMKKEKN